jgi:hypothetical protein
MTKAMKHDVQVLPANTGKPTMLYLNVKIYLQCRKCILLSMESSIADGLSMDTSFFRARNNFKVNLISNIRNMWMFVIKGSIVITCW